MHHFLRSVAATAIALALLSACATIVSKSTYPVSISSTPLNVGVRITDRLGAVIYEGVTPVTLPLKAGSGYFKPAFYEVTLSLEGYKEQTFFIEGEIDGWYFGNFGFGGPLGFLVVDPLTGAMWKLPNQYYSFSLAPDDEASTKQLKILNIEEVPDSLRDKLVPLQESSKN